MSYAKNVLRLAAGVFTVGMMFGCAGLEYNVKQDRYFHKELVEADLAVDAARKAGKDRQCPVEFRSAEELKDRAYSVYAACHTQEGIDLARQATAKANALCPPTPMAAPMPVEPVVIVVTEPRAEEKVAVVASEKMAEKVVVLALEDVHFDFNSSELRPEARTILKRNIQLLKENPKARIRIAGYTSASGTADYNQRLSERRAAAVKDYLVSEGVIVSGRLATIGYGETYPASYEATPKELYSPAAKSNMRVLFEIILE